MQPRPPLPTDPRHRCSRADLGRLAALFAAQATNTHLTLTGRLTILAVAILTSEGASGVQGASFIARVGTLSVVPTIPVAGMALIFGIDRLMSMFRALINRRDTVWPPWL